MNVYWRYENTMFLKETIENFLWKLDLRSNVDLKVTLLTTMIFLIGITCSRIAKIGLILILHLAS